MAGNKRMYRPEEEQQIMVHLWSPVIADDPEAFVRFVFPWGKEGTPLAEHKGPREWQIRVLREIRDQIKEQKKNKNAGFEPDMFRKAVCSGRGIGKSALVAWLIMWMMSTRLGSSTIVSANNEAQLRSVTWGELAKWHSMAINYHWFDLSATRLEPAQWFGQLIQRDLKIGLKYYYTDAKLWTKENPDAYAGNHNPLGILLIFDEASGIDDPIWSVAQGFFTEPVVDRYWMAFSNPRRPSGAFFNCFHIERDFWRSESIDSRTVEGTDKALFDKIIKIKGIDSDEVKVEILGQFPSQGDAQFISRSLVVEAQKRDTITDDHAALIMGVDVARFGDDSSVACFRRGRDARSIPAEKWRGLDNMQLAYRIAALIDKHKPDAVCIDAGNGTGVIDRLREMRYKINEVWFGSKSDEPEYANRRAMMWGRMKEWLEGACISDDKELEDDLCGPNKKFARNGDQIILESKEEMKKRGLHSPDYGDALACTFHVRVSRKDTPTYRNKHYNFSIPGEGWLGA